MSSAKRAAYAIVGPDRARAVAARLRDRATWLSYRASSEGRRSARSLEALTGAHSGERCVIIGNGPSLNETDLTLLRDEKLFSLNRGYLLFDRLGRASDFLVTVNALVIDQSLDELLALPSLKFLSWPALQHVRERHDVVLLRNRHRPGFYSDPAHSGLWEGATVTYVALQLAFALGFATAILIGVDHRFSSQGQPHTIVTHAHDEDPNHFAPSYFGTGYRWQLPDLQESAVAYRLARDAYAAAGRQVIDATVDGDLHVFSKMDLAHALAETE